MVEIKTDILDDLGYIRSRMNVTMATPVRAIDAIERDALELVTL